MNGKALRIEDFRKGGYSRPEVRILLLEDNPVDAELIEYELKGAGLHFTARRVETKEDYTKALVEFSPDLILSDYDLPRYSGNRALTEAKEKLPEVPFILVTGVLTEDRAIEVLTNGARDYVLKNRLERLVPAVQRALAELEEHKARKKAEQQLREAHRDLELLVKERTAALQEEIAERKRAEDFLRESEERFSKSFYASPAASIIRCLSDGTFVDVNEKYLELFDLERDEVIGRTSADLNIQVAPEERERVTRHFRKHGSVHNCRLTLKSRSGKELIVIFSTEKITLGGEEHAISTVIDITDHQRAEEALRESRALLSAVTDNSPDPIFIKDRQSRFVFANPALLQVWGKSPDEVIGKTDRELNDDQTIADTVMANDRLVMESGQSRAMEETIKTQDGMRTYLSMKTPRRDGSGKIIGVIGIARDITDRKRAEDALKESEEKYRLLFETSLSGILLTTEDGTIISANPAALRILGRSEEEIVKAGRVEVADMSDPRMKHAVEERARTGKFFGEVNFRKKDGSAFPAEISSAVFQGKRGAGFASIIFNDINWRKKFERILLESEERFREMADAMPQLVWTGTPDGRIDYFNRRHEEFSGVTKNPDGFWNWTAAVHPEDLPLTLDVLMRAITAGGTNQVEHRLKKKDGHYRWHLSRGVPVHDEKGKLIKWIGTTTDIHDLKEAVQNSEERGRQLEDANKELESFSYSISHDLRAPLRAVDGFSSLLVKTAGGKLEEGEIHNLDVIRENARKMNRLIDDLLSLSRLGRKEVSRRHMDMNRIVEEVWDEQRQAHPDRKLELKSGDLPKALGDRNLLRQVLTNLLANAVKFTKKRKNAVIEVGGEMKDSECIYYVRDNGAGFDMKYSDRLFGVFQRLHSESEYEGTGVGLAIVQRIIHRHGGRVWAEGKVGKGATFYFTLPPGTPKQP